MAKKVKRLWLKTHHHARRSLSRILREFHDTAKEKRDVNGFRAMVYAFNTLLSYFQLQKDIDLDRQYEEIKAEMEKFKRELQS